MNIAMAFLVFLLIAFALWGIAELRYRGFSYVEDQPHHPDPTARKDGDHRELGLRDILRDNSTRGYSAV